MATVANGVTCSNTNCRTLVTCVGDDTADEIYGNCPCCGTPATFHLTAPIDRVPLVEQVVNVAAVDDATPLTFTPAASDAIA